MNEITDEEVILAIGNRVHPVLEAVALDDGGVPIRVQNHHAECGALLWVGFHDFNGLRWLARYYENANSGAKIDTCPVCAGRVGRETMISLLEMDRRIDALCERAAAGVDAELIVAITALCDRGQDFEEVAALFARSGDELRAEISAWCANQSTQPTLLPNP